MSETDKTLNAVLDVFRGVIVAVASATRSDMGAIADSLESMSASPQFDPRACQMLSQLAKEFGPLRSR